MSSEDNEGGGFLSRWSRRKVQAQQGLELPPEAPRAPVAVAQAAPVQAVSAPPAIESEAPPPPPTLDDVALLTPQSDFRRFIAPDVDPGVKNAAMKKLFADPHFNVMDGLDTYIDDYNKSEPVPRSILRQLMSARVLGLLDDELEEQDKPAPDNPPRDEDLDLQLQPDDAAPGGVADGGAGPTDHGPHDAVPPRGA